MTNNGTVCTNSLIIVSANKAREYLKGYESGSIAGPSNCQPETLCTPDQYERRRTDMIVSIVAPIATIRLSSNQLETNRMATKRAEYDTSTATKTVRLTQPTDLESGFSQGATDLESGFSRGASVYTSHRPDSEKSQISSNRVMHISKAVSIFPTRLTWRVVFPTLLACTTCTTSNPHECSNPTPTLTTYQPATVVGPRNPARPTNWPFRIESRPHSSNLHGAWSRTGTARKTTHRNRRHWAFNSPIYLFARPASSLWYSQVITYLRQPEVFIDLWTKKDYL